MRSFSKAVLCALLLSGTACFSQTMKPIQASLCVPCIRGDMSFLASDELHGRGSGTRDEHLAAIYASSLFAGFGLEPGGDHGSFLQKAPLPSTLPPPIARHMVGFAQVPEPKPGTWWVFCTVPMREKARSC